MKKLSNLILANNFEFLQFVFFKGSKNEVNSVKLTIFYKNYPATRDIVPGLPWHPTSPFVVRLVIPVCPARHLNESFFNKRIFILGSSPLSKILVACLYTVVQFFYNYDVLLMRVISNINTSTPQHIFERFYGILIARVPQKNKLHLDYTKNFENRLLYSTVHFILAK